MKLGTIVQIKNKEDINFEVCNSPGWDCNMDIYYGKTYEISHICKKTQKKWIRLKNIPDFVWHIEWLIDVPYLEDELFEI